MRKKIYTHYNSSWPKCCVTKSCKSSKVLEPLYSEIFSPFLYKNKVGNPSTYINIQIHYLEIISNIYERDQNTSCSLHNDLLASTVQSTLTIFTLGLEINFFPNSSQVGASRLQ